VVETQKEERMIFRIASRFFPYTGGKHFLVKKLLPLIPPHRVYVEVFGGAAALLFAKQPSQEEVYNDIDSNLVNVFMVVRDRKDEFLKRLEWLPFSRELYARFTKDLDEGKIIDPLERAVAFFYCMRSCFAGRFGSGWAFTRKGPSRASRWANVPESLASIAERIRKLDIDHLDFRQCIKNRDAPDVFFFLDPPYLDVKQANKLAMTEQDHVDLADLLLSVQGKWLLTYGNHPLIRRLYRNRGFVVQTIRSSMASRKWGQGLREGALVNLVIRNYRLRQRAGKQVGRQVGNAL